ncbi:methyl-accepting chemotaxis protein/methyl-accepting chemotaxis protein-2 (aspartate sensor receptor)|uniref:Methyl-accepting chemotaxis protein/methyl-accepting chemotaxis protein-2 (Aspartate sensor receptor) n=1 Tax=Brenneria salicis ATCC 15712 = DSM 30166 TaxID=714314 RepID=A0A366I0I5_9GAMM|nr:methyl-accepting chemotaxis protein [Brenneria salicis]NMN91221.1 methyl-accepting chemotaxis protein/methyl-accepting chemotaxis protein-2 (aspartate sensor receptor) [Brenneria salicis ATCC 15712 = DSM 30166]RBP60450.1 methyl-accepting chemotaxis protein/methyl-accepting chemotaxis protein-2 (aspartate sensor receptor) [Brenneria salicis ATCC 15712 = DSM 30166]RLM30077.1 chemotaxis protein [Brenneria salicis ATCC 15712 = DSM 30166]
MSLSNWRIGYRLGAGFSFLLLMLLIVGGITISKLTDFQNKMDSIVSQSYQLTQKGNQLIDELNRFLNNQQLLLLLKSQTEINQQLALTKESSSIISGLMNDLQKSVSDEKSLVILQNIAEIRREFLGSTNKLTTFILAGNTDEALAEYFNITRMSQQRYIEKVTEFIDVQDDNMGIAAQDVAASYHETLILLTIIIITSVIIGLIIATLITRSVTHPIKEALVVAENVAQGDLTSEIRINRKDETGMLLTALHHMNISLRQIVSQVRDGAETISSAASQIAAGNQDLSARTEEQASSLEETASSMEQLTSTIKNTADNTVQATSLAASTSETVQKSGDMMSRVTQEMRGIRDSSQRMSEIIGVIDGIAFQTNILALNAAVEAARAGEQGRGFAVVASEVRALAQRSATAAKEIKELIDDSFQKVQAGMGLVEETGVTMNSLVTNVQGVNDIISEIAQASREQSDGINQINLAVGQIDTTTQQNAALVEESAAAALSLQDQAHNLTQTVSLFKLGSAFTGPASGQKPQTSVLLAAKSTANTGEKEKKIGEPADWTSF